VHNLDGNPVLPLFIGQPAHLEAVNHLLRSYHANIDGVGKNLLDGGKVPDKPPMLRVGNFKLPALVPQALFPIPPDGGGDFLVLQPAPDIVGAVSVAGVVVDFSHNPRGFLVGQKMVFVLRVFPVAERGQTAGKLAGFRFRQVGRMYFLAHVPAIHFVQDIAERGYVVLNVCVYRVIEGDIPYMVAREKFLQ